MEEEYTYESEVDNNLQCPICRNAFVEPTMSSACQHVFCLDCISTALSLSPTCPIDRSRLSRDDLVPAPRIIQQMVQELRVVCPYAKHGCAVVCERSLLSNHLQRECKHKGKGKQTEQEASIDDEAVERCAECDQLVKLSQSSSHPDTCPALPTICEYCADQILHRSALPAHLLLCPTVPIPCPHTSHGCTARLPRHQMVEEHLEIACPYEPIKECLTRYDGRIFEVESENFALRTRVGGLESGMEEMRGMLEGIKAGLGTYFVEPTRSTDRNSSTRPTNGTGRLAVDQITPLSASPSVSDDHYLQEFYDEFVAPIYPTPTPPPLTIQSTSHTTPSLLTTTLDSISTSLASLHQELSNIESRRNGDLFIADETRGQFAEELGSIKGVVHGMRMQMHHLLMEFTRMTGGRGMFAGGINQSQGGGGQQGVDLSSRYRDRGSEGSNSDDDSPNALPHLSLPVQPNSRMFFQPPPMPIYGTSGSSSGSGSNYSNGGGGGLGMGMMPRRFSQQETKL